MPTARSTQVSDRGIDICLCGVRVVPDRGNDECRTGIAPVGTASAETSSAVCDSVSAGLFWCPEGASARAIGERKKSNDRNFVCEFG